MWAQLNDHSDDDFNGSYSDGESSPSEDRDNGGTQKKKDPKRFTLLPRHLDRAINVEKIKFFREHFELWDHKRYPVPSSAFQDLSSGIVHQTNIMNWISDHFKQLPLEDKSANTHAWKQVSSASILSVRTQMTALFGGLSHVSYDYIDKVQSYLGNDNAIHHSLLLKANIIQFHDQLDILTKEVSGVRSIPGFPWLQLVDDCFLLTEFPGGPIMVPYTIVLCVADKLESYFGFLCYVKLAALSPERQGFDVERLALTVYDLLDRVYKQYANIAIDFFKALEPLIVGWVLEMMGPSDSMEVLAVNTEKDLLSDHPEFASHLKELRTLLYSYFAEYGEPIIPYLIEQFGQEKMHFYPIVDPDAGLNKMYRVGTAYRDLEDEAVTDVLGELKKGYVVAYKQEHGHIPSIKQSTRYSPKIQELLAEQTVGTLKESSRIPNEEWAKLEFQSHQIFSYCTDTLELLDDKALCPHWSKINQIYSAEVRRLKRLPFIAELDQTRLVLAMMSKESIDIKSFFERVIQEGRIPIEWAVILLMEKELELKIAARVFSVLTFECRMMASVCERNLSKVMFRYFPQQSMTDTGAELKFKIDNYSKLLKGSKGDWVAIHLDLEQWNYTFREKLMHPFAKFFDQVFGVKCYDVVMKIFTQSRLISANRYHHYSDPSRFITWNNHAGGNQGICQKFWTLITIATIKSVMGRYKHKYQLIGSGDNQVLLIELRNVQLKRDKIHIIVSKLKEKFAAIGLSVKSSESWYSMSLLAYQRKYSLRGIPCPAGIKQSAKAYAGGTDINGGLNSFITTAMNGGMSIADNVSNPIIGPLYAYFEALSSLVLGSRTKSIGTLSQNQLVALTLLNGDLGGFPFLQLPNFLHSGHKDMVGECLSLLRHIWDRNLLPKYIIAAVVDLDTSPITPDVTLQLVINPMSLNIKKPVTPESIIKTRVERYLLNTPRVINTQLREVFSLLNTKDQVEFATDLLQIRPYHLSIVHSLFENSCIGQALHTINRFNRITSIARLVGKESPYKSVNLFRVEIERADKKLTRYIIGKLRKAPIIQSSFFEQVTKNHYLEYQEFCSKHEFMTECTFSLRLFLTTWTYGLGSELAFGPFVPAPSEQLKFLEHFSPSDLTTSIVVAPHEHMPNNMHILENSIGPYKTYIGSKTADPVKTLKLVNLEGLDAGAAIKVYLKIHAWMKASQSDPKIINYLENQICKRMPELEDILPYIFSGTAGGTLIHRYEALGFVMGCFTNSRSNISTHYFLTTNCATALQRGDNDRFIFYQSLFHYIFSALRFCTPYYQKLAVKINIEHCGYKTPEIRFTLNPERPLKDLPLIEGLMITGDALIALRAEAAHQQKLLQLVTWRDSTAQECLCAYVAYDLASDIQRFNVHGGGITSSDLSVAAGQGKYSVTVLRILELPLFLKFLSLAFLSVGAFHSGFSKSRLMRLFSFKSSSSTALTNFTPYKNFFEAFTVAGRVDDLCKYTCMPYVWRRGDRHYQLLQMLFMGCNKANSDRRYKDKVISLIVEARTTSYKYNMVYRALRGWSVIIRRSGPDRINTSNPTVLQQSTRKDPLLRLLIVPTKDLILERGRRLLSLEASDIVTERRLLYITPIPPLNALLSLTPWSYYTAKLNDTINPLAPIKPPFIPITPFHDSLYGWSHKIGRWLYSSSSSYLKMLELIYLLNLENADYRLVVSLADGSGSQFSALLHLYNEAVGVHNTKYHSEEVPSFQAVNMIAPSLFCQCDILKKVLNLKHVWKWNGDLTVEDTWSDLSTYILPLVGVKSILSWDLESFNIDLDYAWQFFFFYLVEWKINTLIIKIYYPITSELLMPGLSALGQVYDTVKIIKPSYSPINTGEHYIVYQGFHEADANGKLVPLELLYNTLATSTQKCAIVAIKQWETTIVHQVLATSGLRPCAVCDPLVNRPYSTPKAALYGLFSHMVDMLLGIGIPKDFSTFIADLSLSHMTRGQTHGAIESNKNTWLTWGVLICLLRVTNKLIPCSFNTIPMDPGEPWYSALISELLNMELELNNKELTNELSRKVGCLLHCVISGLTISEYSIIGWISQLTLYIFDNTHLSTLKHLMKERELHALRERMWSYDDQVDVLWTNIMVIQNIQEWFLRHFHLSEIRVKELVVHPRTATERLVLLVGLPNIDETASRDRLFVDLTIREHPQPAPEGNSFIIQFITEHLFDIPSWSLTVHQTPIMSDQGMVNLTLFTQPLSRNDN